MTKNSGLQLKFKLRTGQGDKEIVGIAWPVLSHTSITQPRSAAANTTERTHTHTCMYTDCMCNKAHGHTYTIYEVVHDVRSDRSFKNTNRFHTILT